jgi:hypothetical protein
MAVAMVAAVVLAPARALVTAAVLLVFHMFRIAVPGASDSVEAMSRL